MGGKPDGYRGERMGRRRCRVGLERGPNKQKEMSVTEGPGARSVGGEWVGDCIEAKG